MTTKTYKVTFVGNYFTLTTFADAENDEQAVANAMAFIQDQHGFDMEAEAFDAIAELDGQFIHN